MKAIKTQMDQISQNLTQRIKELADRYDKPLPKLHNKVEELTATVESHLKKMGYTLKGA